MIKEFKYQLGRILLKFSNVYAEMIAKEFTKKFLHEKHELRSAGEARFAAKSELVQLTNTDQNEAGEDILLVDVNKVSEVLGNPKYKDCYAAIYTIAGPTRGGKSFLLSLLYQFLQQSKRENSYNEWLKNKEKVEKVFRWSRSATPCTQGVYILKEPIVICFGKEKIALFLVDTQGMFDNETSEQNQSFLGTFNFLLSSCVLFNVDRGIKTTDLEAIYKSAKNLKDRKGSYLLQKQSLMFVVRNWLYTGSDGDNDDADDNENFPYGMEGGKKYFETLILRDSTKRAEEHKMMRDFLVYALGDNIPCCLLPYPGDVVGRKSCSVADLSNDFRRESYSFFQKITNANSLKITKIQTKRCKCGELCETIKDYVSQLGPGLSVADQNSYIVQDFRAKMSRHVKNRVKEFLMMTESHDISIGNYEAVQRFENHLERLKPELKSKFRNEAGEFYSERAVDEWEGELDRILSQATKIFMGCVHADEAYQNAILQFSHWLKSDASSHLKEGKDNMFAPRARSKRNLLFQEMENAIRQHAKDEDLSQEIVSQCNEYFLMHTNKLTADIDDDIESFLNRMKVARFFMTGIVAIALAAVSIPAAVAGMVAAAIDRRTKVDTAGEIATENTIGTKDNLIKAGILKVNQGAQAVFDKAVDAVGKPIFSWYDGRIQNKSDVDVSTSALTLQEYKEGEMKVNLRFGTLIFKLEVRDNLQQNSQKPSSSAK